MTSGLITRNGGARINTTRGYHRISWPEWLYREARRAVLLWWFRWQLDCNRSEVTGYYSITRAGGRGVRLGKNYRREMSFQRRVLRGRIAFLECRLDY